MLVDHNTLGDVGETAQTSADVAVTTQTEAPEGDTSQPKPLSFLERSANAIQSLENDVEIDNETNEQGLEGEEADRNDDTEPEPEPIPKPDRVSGYKALKAERDAFNEQIEKINATTASIGGLDGLPHLANVFSAFLSPGEKFAVNELDAEGNPTGQQVEKTGSDLIRDFVNDLPSAPDIYSDFFLKGMENEQNRVFAFNDALTQMFGVESANLSTNEIDVVMEHLAAKLNTAKTAEERRQVFEDLKLETSSLGFDQQESALARELRIAKEQIAQLQNQGKQTQEKEQDPVKAWQQNFEQETARLQKHVEAENNLLVERFNSVGGEFIGKYGLTVSEKDAPEMKEAKELLNDLLLGKSNIAYEIRQSAAFQTASKFLEKGTLKTVAGNIASNNLNAAFRSKVNTVLAKLSPLLVVAAQPKGQKKALSNSSPDIAAITPNAQNSEKRQTFRERSEAVLKNF